MIFEAQSGYTGRYLFWPSSVSSSMRIEHSYTAAKLFTTHHAPDATSLLVILVIITVIKV